MLGKLRSRCDLLPFAFRLVEEADYQATLELFGGDKNLETFIPKTQKEFEEYARMIAHKVRGGDSLRWEFSTSEKGEVLH
jgi:hypothetical protein